MTTNIADIHIVGAGLCGTLLAVLLAKHHGLRINLYESRQDLRKFQLPAGRSINLALARRGIDALAAADMMNEVNDHVIPMYGRQLHTLAGEQNMVGYSSDLSQAIYSISRTKLNEILLNAADKTGLINIYFEYKCTNNNVREQVLEFNDQIQVPYNLCVGADGFGSQVREYSIPPNDISIESLGHSYKELTIPAKNNSYQMLVNALHIWPRGEYMLIALPNIDKSFTATLFLPDNTEYSLSNFRHDSEVISFFEKEFPDVIPLIPDLTQQFFANPIGKLATIRCNGWYANRTVLMGDAAHAIVPFHGQGMNCAFEDALCFNELYGEYRHDLSKLISEYVAARINNVNAIADMALENYIEMRDTVASPNFKLRKQISWQLQNLYPEKFIPRYNMVMFENIPYYNVQQLGKEQDTILNKLSMGIDSIEQLNLKLAKNLILEYIQRFTEQPTTNI